MIRSPTAPDGYSIVRQISSGGFGDVFELRHNRSRVHYAGKMIQCLTPKAQEQIDREVARLRMFNHPGIVKLKEVKSMANMKVIVMELGGQSLAEKVQYYKGLGDDFPRNLVYQVIKTASSALNAMHSCSGGPVAHGDIKLENILLDDEGNVKLCDLGAAVREDDTASHSVMTYIYMSPERANSPSLQATAQADVWALGVVLHQLLFGKPHLQSTSLPQLVKDIDDFRVQMIGHECGQNERFLLMKLLDPNPRTRITSYQLCDPDTLRCLVNSADDVWRVLDSGTPPQQPQQQYEYNPPLPLRYQPPEYSPPQYSPPPSQPIERQPARRIVETRPAPEPRMNFMERGLRDYHERAMAVMQNSRDRRNRGERRGRDRVGFD
ncbi:putative CBL-interacting protein kinase 23 [Blattamonas nauphoetae]|uniref:non-specific serine/threonine protein kinase n=1 Tax=Blattamonas nauphoetae TaxID=2049346 RepID=A0ABQ9XP84_9EUKA|nr:putative CBL-interacting protein kinase 23 [Blattamonas nauphoetae]